MKIPFRKAAYTLTEPLLLKTLKESRLPPVFIVGNPRSGTTVVYQYLAAHFDICYFSNLERRYFRSPVSSAYFSRPADKFKAGYVSNFGEIAGKTAISDGWEIFNRFFNYYFNPGKTRDLAQLKNIIRIISGIYGKNLIVKNNSNSLRLAELFGLFPDALFIQVRRKPVENLWSVISGRKENNISPDDFWGAGPERTLFETIYKNELELAAFQYIFVNRFMDRFFEMVRSGKQLTVDYEAFCDNPKGLLLEIKKTGFAAIPERGLLQPDFFKSPGKNMPAGFAEEAAKALRQMTPPATALVSQIFREFYPEISGQDALSITGDGNP